MTSTHDVTQLLKAWTAGDERALEKITPLVYEQLHRAARYYMAGQRSGHILQTTALVNEVYLQLVDCGQMNWQDRAHFFAMSAQLMRRILVDFPEVPKREVQVRSIYLWTRSHRSVMNPIQTCWPWMTR